MQHSFDVSVAQKVGVNAAILLGNMLYWIEKNAANGKHMHDGRYWTYNSTKAFAAMFPYFTQKQIYTILSKLIDDGYIMKGNYNDANLDRTMWYSFTDKGIELMRGCMSENICIVEKKATKPEEQPSRPIIDAEWYKVVKCYEANIGLIPCGYSGDTLYSFYEDLGADVICKAIEVTNFASAYNPQKYLFSVLNKWVENGINSVEKAEAYTKDLDRRLQAARQHKSGQTDAGSQPPAISGDFY